MPPPDRLPFGVLVEAFAAAVGRVPADDSVGGVDAFPAVFESLAWAGVIHDRLTKDPAGVPPAILGLAFVRNVVLHTGIDVLLLIPGTYYGSGTYGSGTYGGVPQRVFPPRRVLAQTRRQPTGESEYDTHVAGRRVLDVFQEAVEAARALIQRCGA